MKMIIFYGSFADCVYRLQQCPAKWRWDTAVFFFGKCSETEVPAEKESKEVETTLEAVQESEPENQKWTTEPMTSISAMPKFNISFKERIEKTVRFFSLRRISDEY